jgi:hypothetical protein
MTAAAKKERAKYMREWRKRNPEKTREYDERKWERKAEQAMRQRAAAAEADRAGACV